ncbi:glycosyltransferase family 39 protein [Aquirufa nivalisilvae]
MKNKGLFVLSFFALMLLALGLRTYHIGQFGLFGDEKQSLLLAVGNTNFGGMTDMLAPPKTFTPEDFWKSRGIKAWLDADARGDVSGNSLVHDMMLKLFAFLFGKEDGVIRSVSVLFNMLTLWLLFYWARKIRPQSRVFPIIILALAVIEPFFVIYSQQARNYTTSIFFTTASNFYFWSAMQAENQQKSTRKKWILWMLTSLAALFSTYLTALVFVGQLIFSLTQRNSGKFWQKHILSGILVIIPFASWMLWGPGQYFLAYQADAAKQYREFLEHSGPIAGWIEPATAGNLYKRTVSILSDQFLWTNDLYVRHGFKIGAICLLLFGVGVISWLKSLSKEVRSFYIFGIIQIAFPVLVLILSAINAGTTTGFFLRYASFGLPFGIFISVGLAEYAFQQAIWIRIVSSIFLFIQVNYLVQILLPLYSDKVQKYTFAHDRRSNPYIEIAHKIKQQYQVGDTVIYPSKMNNFLNSAHLQVRAADVSDAQLTNVYFEPTDLYVQKIDTLIQDSVLLKKKNGRRLLIFDFKKGKYRY